MRVVAGKAKGIGIKAPKGTDTRPTSDKVREAIFSTLADRVVGARVLDLYAGSGALGIESISRRAQVSFFVDKSPIATRAIRENLKKLGFEENSRIIKKIVLFFLKTYKGAQFDLIFLDPPYKISVKEILPVIKSSLSLLAKDGLLIVEHTKKLRLQDHTDVYKTRAYGQTMISYIKGG